MPIKMTKSKLTSHFAKVELLSWNQLLKLNQPSNDHNFINTTPIEWNYHRMMHNLDSYPTIRKSKKIHKYWVQNAQKHVVHFGFGFRWKTTPKEMEAKESLNRENFALYSNNIGCFQVEDAYRFHQGTTFQFQFMLHLVVHVLVELHKSNWNSNMTWLIF